MNVSDALSTYGRKAVEMAEKAFHVKQPEGYFWCLQDHEQEPYFKEAKAIVVANTPKKATVFKFVAPVITTPVVHKAVKHTVSPAVRPTVGKPRVTKRVDIMESSEAEDEG